jgi:hypothetical protein
LKSNADLPLYISRDPKPTVDLRARLRLGSALTPAQQYKYKHAGTPFCPHHQCIAQFGNARHMIMECPRFQVARYVCERRLRDEPYFSVPLTFELVLGLAPTIPKQLAKERAFAKDTHSLCLDITGEFILAINRANPL